MLKQLFDMAVSNLQSGSTKGKGFELYVLWRMLRRVQANSFTVTHQNVKGGVLKFAGGPASADRHRYSYFLLSKDWEQDQEAWISVQVLGISAEVSGNHQAKAAYHEIDVATFYAGIPLAPTYKEMTFGASCKHTPFSKAYLREALGLRRETAFFQWKKKMHESSASWFISDVPANPASPLALFSTDPKCNNYQQPVDSLGVYVRYFALPFLTSK